MTDSSKSKPTKDSVLKDETDKSDIVHIQDMATSRTNPGPEGEHERIDEYYDRGYLYETFHHPEDPDSLHYHVVRTDQTPHIVDEGDAATDSVVQIGRYETLSEARISYRKPTDVLFVKEPDDFEERFAVKGEDKFESTHAELQITYDPNINLPYLVHKVLTIRELGVFKRKTTIYMNKYETLGSAQASHPTAVVISKEDVPVDGGSDIDKLCDEPHFEIRYAKFSSAPFQVFRISSLHLDKFIRGFKDLPELKIAFPNAELSSGFPMNLLSSDVKANIDEAKERKPRLEVKYTEGVTYPIQVFEVSENHPDKFIQGFQDFARAQNVYPDAIIKSEFLRTMLKYDEEVEVVIDKLEKAVEIGNVDSDKTVREVSSQTVYEETEGIGFEIRYAKDATLPFRVVGTGSINMADHVQDFKTLQEAISAFPTADYNVFNLNVEITHDPDFEDFSYRVDVKDTEGQVIYNQGFKSLKKAKKAYPHATFISNITEFPPIFSNEYPVVRSNNDSIDEQIVFLQDVVSISVQTDKLNNNYRMTLHVNLDYFGIVRIGYCSTKLENEKSHMKSIVSKWMGELLYRVSDARGFTDKQPGNYSESEKKEFLSSHLGTLNALKAEIRSLLADKDDESFSVPERMAYGALSDRLLTAIEVLSSRWDEPSSDYKTSQPTEGLDY